MHLTSWTIFKMAATKKYWKLKKQELAKIVYSTWKGTKFKTAINFGQTFVRSSKLNNFLFWLLP